MALQMGLVVMICEGQSAPARAQRHVVEQQFANHKTCTTGPKVPTGTNKVRELRRA